jgi:hypothetical protein
LGVDITIPTTIPKVHINKTSGRKKAKVTTPNDEGLSDKWETTESIKSVCLIQARTGNVRTYIVGKVKLKEATVLVN